MRIVLDTNVFISGIFFSGPPYKILRLWREGIIEIVLTDDILDEYIRVGDELSHSFPSITVTPFVNMIRENATFVKSYPLRTKICTDHDDDKFIACALGARCKIIISGDKHLLNVSGYQNIDIIKPKDFIDKYLNDKKNR